MKKHSIYLFIFTICLACLSCQKEIDISIPDKERQTVINCLFTSNETLTVNLTKSLSIIDRADVVFLDDASIKLYQNNSFIQDLQHIGNGNYIGDHMLQNQANYTIEVNRKGKISRASSAIPLPVEILSVDTSTIRIYDYDYLQCLIEFKDRPDEKNFYMLSIDNIQVEIYEYYDEYDQVFRDTSYYNNNYIESDDIIIEHWLYIGDHEYIMFSDNLISGKTYQLNIHVEKAGNYYYDDFVQSNDTSTVIFNLYSVSEPYYQYFKTLSMHMDAKENPFAEPVQVYSNIENGLGVFAGFSSDSDSIQVFSKPFIGL